jgi:hypothetical protein
MHQVSSGRESLRALTLWCLQYGWDWLILLLDTQQHFGYRFSEGDKEM